MTFENPNHYQFNLLFAPNMVRIPKNLRTIWKRVKAFQATFKIISSSAEDVIIEFKLLTMYLREENKHCLCKAYTFLKMPTPLSERAERHLSFICNGSILGGRIY